MKPFRYLKSDTIEFAGFPDLDTLSIQYLELGSPKLIVQWRKAGLLEGNKNIKERLYAISGFKDDSQIVILDTNFNHDFSDETAVSFDKKTRFKYENNFEAIDSLASFAIKNVGFENRKPIQTTLYLKAFPIYDHPKMDQEKYLKLVAEEKQYYKGAFSIDSTDFKVVLDNGLFGDDILIEPINNDFKLKRDPAFITYHLKDTLSLVNKYYRIDSISSLYQTVFLKALDIKKKEFGFRKGYKLKDFNIQTIDNAKQISIKELLTLKPYVLFDFWGTWCAPCMELTPDLIDINNTYKDNLNIVSIAVEPKLDNVKRYAQKISLHGIIII